MEKISEFKYQELRIELFYKGDNHLPFSLYIHNELMYTEYIKPSPLHDVDSIDTMISLLGFILLGPGDIEQDFFDRRSCPPLDSWIETDENSTALEIQLMINDYMFSTDEDYLKDNYMTIGEAERLLKYFKSY